MLVSVTNKHLLYSPTYRYCFPHLSYFVILKLYELKQTSCWTSVRRRRELYGRSTTLPNIYPYSVLHYINPLPSVCGCSAHSIKRRIKRQSVLVSFTISRVQAALRQGRIKPSPPLIARSSSLPSHCISRRSFLLSPAVPAASGLNNQPASLLCFIYKASILTRKLNHQLSQFFHYKKNQKQKVGFVNMNMMQSRQVVGRYPLHYPPCLGYAWVCQVSPCWCLASSFSWCQSFLQCIAVPYRTGDVVCVVMSPVAGEITYLVRWEWQLYVLTPILEYRAVTD